jgi:hypothetical protein
LKKIKIPLLDTVVEFYHGAKEYKKFIGKLDNSEPTVFDLRSFIGDEQNAPEGIHNGSCLWIKDEKDLSVLVHELTHLIDFFSESYGFSDEMEFRAYLMEYVFSEIFKYLQRS